MRHSGSYGLGYDTKHGSDIHENGFGSELPIKDAAHASVWTGEVLTDDCDVGAGERNDG